MKYQLLERENPIRLTLRDGELLLFLLEMKFATKELIHARFFKKLLSGSESQSLEYARERIALLKKNGLIISAKHPFDWRAVLLPTLKAHRWISSRFPDRDVPSPMGRLEIATFEHDSALLSIRVALEGSRKVKTWISDRQLRSLPGIVNRFSSHNVPDALIESSEGSWIALELEIAQKSKEKYHEKIRKYVSVLRDKQLNIEFQKVVFICPKESVAKVLRRETRLYEEYFEVHKVDLLRIGDFNV